MSERQSVLLSLGEKERRKRKKKKKEEKGAGRVSFKARVTTLLGKP
jgi:hypothetical protein